MNLGFFIWDISKYSFHFFKRQYLVDNNILHALWLLEMPII